VHRLIQYLLPNVKPWLELASEEGHANEREKFEGSERIVACVRDGNNKRLVKYNKKKCEDGNFVEGRQ
jgi:hypothetical protein